MPGAFLLRLRRHGILRICLAEACSWSYPSCLPGVVVDIVGSPKMVLTSFPAIWQSPLSIFKSTVCPTSAGGTVCSTLWWRGAIRCRHGRCGSRRHGRRTLAESMSRGLGGEGWRFAVDWCGVEAPLTAGPVTDGCGDAVGRTPFAAPWLMGAARLVERLRISLPWTTMLSLDFLRSRVSISAGSVSSCMSCLVAGEECLPSPPASRSITEPMRTLMTPRKPWSFFLNFFWSKI
jgi:hypothetical protein